MDCKTGCGCPQLRKEVERANIGAKRKEVRTLLVECLAEAMQSRDLIQALLRVPFDPSEEEVRAP